MQKRLDALEATGVPFDDASAEAAYIERTSPAHTDRWLAVMDEFESAEFKQSRTGVYNFDAQLTELPFEASGPWSCEAATRRFIEANQPKLQEVRELCQFREAVRFPIYFNSIETFLPYTQHMRDVGRLLWTDGQIAIRDRDGARVCADIEALLDATQVCSGEPWAVSQLVCIAIKSMALDLIKLAVEHDCLSLEELKRLMPKLIERSELADQWQKTIEGERCMALPCFLEPHRSFPEPQRTASNSSSIPARGWDCILYLDLMEKARAIDTSSLDSLLAGGRELDGELRESYSGGGWLRTVDGIMTRLMAPAFQALAEAIARDLTETRLATHAVAVAIFGKSRGRWPADFAELKLPEADLSPSGGQPFGYRIEPDGRACLWGFSLKQALSTPPEPPSLDVPAGHVEDLRRQIWHLPPP